MGCVLWLSACGSSDTAQFDASIATGLPPVISTVTPTPAAIGATLTVTGYGFSIAAPFNVLTITNGVTSSSVSASTYSLVPTATASATAIEQLTFTIPASTPIGANTVFLFVVGNTSNSDITLTVTP